MINTYITKNKKGDFVDKTPDIWASVNYNGQFLLATKRYGAEADLGAALYDCLARKGSIKDIIFLCSKFGLEAISEKYTKNMEELNLDSIQVASKFNGVTFEYDIRSNGKIYVSYVGDEEPNKPRKISKPAELKKIISELSKRK